MKFLTQSILYRNPNYRCLFIGQFVSFTGTMMTGIVLPYQIYHQTQSTLMVGLLGLFQLLPLLVTALLGGVFADRHHRRLLLLATESLLAIGSLLLAWNAFLPHPHLWLVFTIATFMSAINGFHRPALESITQQMVDKTDFPAVGVLSSFKYSVGMIAGPALGGLILAHYGVGISYLIDTLTFSISLIALLLIRNIPAPQAKHDLSTWLSLKQGFAYAVARQELMGSYWVDFIAMIFGMPMALFPAIAENYGGPNVLGLLYSAPAVGALVISFWSGWAKYFKRHGVGISISASIWGVAIVLFGCSTHLWLALFFLAFAGGADAVSGIFRSTLWNQVIDNQYRGRLAGIEMISYLSGPKLGDTEAGLVAALFGVTASVISGGVLCIVGVGVCAYLMPKFWRYRAD
jgi:MFS family permease